MTTFDDLNCHDCDTVLKQERGCTEKAKVPFYIGRDVYWRCPRKVATLLSWEYIQAYSLYKNHLLPNGSAWLNESNKYIQAMQIVESEVAKIEKEQINKAK